MEHRGKTSTDKRLGRDCVVEKGFSPAYGARFLERTIDEQVKLPLTTMWKDADRFFVDVEDGKISINQL